MTALSRVGAVAIGRNEDQRLVRCLDALRAAGLTTVYVDSGSTDGSVAAAEERGVLPVELDLSRPFTAARARNAGARALIEADPEIDFIQFVDGDCELVDGWIESALGAFESYPDVVAVCGRRRERFPEKTPFNRLADMEWDTPVGEAEACGGDAQYRRTAFEAARGFDETLIAGEEPELCYRLRQRGGKIRRLDAEMTLHDADLHRFGQWWQRTRRSGYAATEAWHKHGPTGEPHMVRIARSALAYAVALPLLSLLACIGLALAGQGWLSLLPLAVWFVFGARVVQKVTEHRIAQGDAPDDAQLYGRYTLIGKFAEAAGAIEFAWNHLRGRRRGLIEYK